MTITVEAVYENGILKPAQPLPLQEHEKVQISVHRDSDIQKALDAVERSHGLLRWSGDIEILRQVAEDDEFGILEAR
jgi:predicted DNA-binding antitoxin AbrB/MazE fold protein